MVEEVKHEMGYPDPTKDKDYVLTKFKDSGSIQTSEYSLLQVLNWLVEEYEVDNFKITKTGFNVWTVEFS